METTIKKGIYRFLVFSVLIASGTTTQAQLKVNQNLEVGIGTVLTDNSKLKVDNQTSPYSLRLVNEFDPAEDEKYGIYNVLDQSGIGQKTGLYNNVSSSANTEDNVYGIQNVVGNAGVEEETFGIHNTITSAGGSAKHGIWNDVKQDANFSNFTGGLTNIIRNSGSGAATGTTNLVVYGDGAKTGAYNYVFANSVGNSYGSYNIMYAFAPSSDDVYGVYSDTYNFGGTGTHYGVYAKVDAANGYAGYFEGDVVVTGTFNPSDRSLKDNIKAVRNSLSLLKKLQLNTYTFKESAALQLPKGQQYGLIAQEVEEVIPNLVREIKVPQKSNSDDILAAIPDIEIPTLPTEKAKSGARPESYKAINYNGLIPILVGAINEQQAQIDELKKTIATMQQDAKTKRK